LSATAPGFIGFIGFTLHAMVAPVETGAERLLEPPVVAANNNSSVLRRAVVAMTRNGNVPPNPKPLFSAEVGRLSTIRGGERWGVEDIQSSS
jgi:hypothetical protein